MFILHRSDMEHSKKTDFHSIVSVRPSPTHMRATQMRIIRPTKFQLTMIYKFNFIRIQVKRPVFCNSILYALFGSIYISFMFHSSFFGCLSYHNHTYFIKQYIQKVLLPMWLTNTTHVCLIITLFYCTIEIFVEICAIRYADTIHVLYPV